MLLIITVLLNYIIFEIPYHIFFADKTNIAMYRIYACTTVPNIRFKYSFINLYNLTIIRNTKQSSKMIDFTI